MKPELPFRKSVSDAGLKFGNNLPTTILGSLLLNCNLTNTGRRTFAPRIRIANHLTSYCTINGTGLTSFVRIANPVSAALLELLTFSCSHPRGTRKCGRIGTLRSDLVSCRNISKIVGPRTFRRVTDLISN